jgi:aldose sugar dehydrogenase
MRLSVLTAAVSAFALAAACGVTGETADATQTGGAPVETNEANAPNQQPAFEGQTRAPGVQTTVQMVSETVAEGLENPWGLVPLPEGGFLVTEKPGRLRLVSAGGEIGAPVAGVPAVVSEGQAGLLDVELSPDFASDRLVYLSFSEPRQGGNGTAVARGRLSEDGTRLERVETIFSAMPTYDNFMHYGSRIVFDRQGRLYVTLGERSDLETRPQAQDLGSHLGKIVRINADGSVPGDNPFVGQDGALPEIWSWGHRNVQGAALHPETGELWGIEHGARGGDEINIARAGENYGWPIAAYGIEYRGGAIGEGNTTAENTVQPIYYWDPVIAPGGAVFYRGDMFPDWDGNLLVSGLAGQHLARLVLDGDRVVGEERLLTALNARIRDVAVGSDGAVYVVTDDENGRLVRLRRAD